MTERVAQIRGTDLFVSFDSTFDNVYIYRHKDGPSYDLGEALSMTHDEWSQLVDQARIIKATARPRGMTS